MGLDTRVAQTTLENLVRDAILYALGSRLQQQTSIAGLRAFATMGPSGTSLRSDDDLISTLITSAITAWRWSAESMAVDNGTTVVQPTDVPAGHAGRWLSFVSALRFSTIVGGASTTLDQITAGPLTRVVVLDRSLSESEIMSLISGEVPAVVIESHGDSPRDATLDVGHQWITEYEFTVTVISQNLRDYRQAAQGSTLDGDPGTNALDGFIKALMSGTILNAAFTNDQPIQNVRMGHAENRFSELGQRRVWRSRDYAFQVSEEFPAAPNDTSTPTDAFVQANLVSLNLQAKYDPNNYLVGGCAPTAGAALTQALSAGSAVIAGVTVPYAGQSLTFSAWSDTYRDLNPGGTMTLLTVTAGGVAPPVTAGALRVGVTRTTGSIVLADTLIAETQAPFGPNNDFPI